MTTATEVPRSLWRNGDFLRFWLGESLSLLGSQVTTLALPLTAISVFHATDEQVGLLRFHGSCRTSVSRCCSVSGSTGSGGAT